MSTDPNVQVVINDAKAAGIVLLGDAKTAATVILTHVASEVTNSVPAFEEAAYSTLLDFIPYSFRNVVNEYVGPAFTAADAAYTARLQAAVKSAVGLAIGRIDAVLDSMATAIGPVTLSAQTTAPPKTDSSV
jgi:hypothetical protein